MQNLLFLLITAYWQNACFFSLRGLDWQINNTDWGNRNMFIKIGPIGQNGKKWEQKLNCDIVTWNNDFFWIPAVLRGVRKNEQK